ncbi:biotin--[acetyl-CoA-carboxylase] ligase [Chitinophaga alhagiae]|uniref:Biotin--[acetyl-CoA-carboxylase] ligase n=1 Tax=Chitinophaga alhagiae TaxID=2203219 RepID=A0ABM6WCK6_9BACT|nr:biotin--[acetyl-CoA-carboxylase] ligase [Chitinophaga alhagiae]AWO01732.1 biotin--[acetyl-CoA-carboxylase] ligase [Chitinophaga alhagiae]
MIGNPFAVLDRVDSTNNYAMARVNEGPVTDGATWFAMEQTAGKGQRGRQWHSAPGENIMLTTVLQPALALHQQFMLSVAIALGAYDLFSKYAGDEARIKWSNDIYWRDRKAGGILIENVLRGNIWQYAIAGIGININTPHFPENLANPVSLRQITGKTWDSVALAHELCACLQRRYSHLQAGSYQPLLQEYKNCMIRFNEPALYRKNGEIFTGVIRDVLPDGRLCLEKGNEMLQLGFGEVEFVFAK